MKPVWFWLGFSFLPGVPGRPFQRVQLVPPSLVTLFMYRGCFIFRFLILQRRDGSHRDLLRLPHVAPQLSCCLLKHFFPHQFHSSKLGSSDTLQCLLPFSSLISRCYFASEYLCALFHTVWYIWEECSQKKLHSHPSDPFFQLFSATKPTTSLETAGLMCYKLSLQLWPKLSPNRVHHGLPHLELFAISANI